MSVCTQSCSHIAENFVSWSTSGSVALQCMNYTNLMQWQLNKKYEWGQGQSKRAANLYRRGDAVRRADVSEFCCSLFFFPQDMSSLHTLQQLVLLPGHMQSVPQFLLSQSQAGQQGKSNESWQGHCYKQARIQAKPPFLWLLLLTWPVVFSQRDGVRIPAVLPAAFCPALLAVPVPPARTVPAGALEGSGPPRGCCVPRVPPGARPCRVGGDPPSHPRTGSAGLPVTEPAPAPPPGWPVALGQCTAFLPERWREAELVSPSASAGQHSPGRSWAALVEGQCWHHNKQV